MTLELDYASTDTEVRHAAASIFERFPTLLWSWNPDSEVDPGNDQLQGPRAAFVYRGIDNTGGDGYDHIEWFDDEWTRFREAVNANQAGDGTAVIERPFTALSDVGDWPLHVEAVKTYDPKDNPPGVVMARFFLTLRLLRIEGEIALFVYNTRNDARSDINEYNARMQELL